MSCDFTQGSSNSERQCLSHRAALHVQPGGEDMPADHRGPDH